MGWELGYPDIRIWSGPCGPGGSSSSGNISGHGQYQAHSGRVAWRCTGCNFWRFPVAGKLFEKSWPCQQFLKVQYSKKSPTGPTERTPKPKYLIALATYLGVRWQGPIQFLKVQYGSIWFNVKLLNFRLATSDQSRPHFPSNQACSQHQAGVS